MDDQVEASQRCRPIGKALGDPIERDERVYCASPSLWSTNFKL